MCIFGAFCLAVTGEIPWWSRHGKSKHGGASSNAKTPSVGRLALGLFCTVPRQESEAADKLVGGKNLKLHSKPLMSSGSLGVVKEWCEEA